MHPWRARLYRWFSPAAKRCPFSPNAITVFSLALNLSAAVLLALGRQMPLLFFVAIAVTTVGGLLDAFDGIVAREQNLTSKFGDFLDHLCDRLGDAALILGWCIGAGVRHEITLAAVFAVMFNGYIGTQLEATFGERTYDGTGRGEFVLALVAFPTIAYSLAVTGVAGRRFAGLTIAEMLTILLIAAAVLGFVQRFRNAIRQGSRNAG